MDWKRWNSKKGKWEKLPLWLKAEQCADGWAIAQPRRIIRPLYKKERDENGEEVYRPRLTGRGR